MKKFLTLFLSFLMLLACVGCGAFRPPEVTPEPPDTGNTDIDDPDDPGDEEDKIVYSVTLICDGRAYFPSEPVDVIWTGEDGSVYTAHVGNNGVATYTGLDGDYRVTLSKLPEGYTYDCNYNAATHYHYADNDNPNVRIEILKIKQTYTAHNGPYMNSGRYEIAGGKNVYNTYRAKLTSQSHLIYFAFTPDASGEYSIESWVDITANEVNPYVDRFGGNSQFVLPAGTQDDGGSASTFTKNFRFLFAVTAAEVGNTIVFAVHADCTGEYPVDVDFTLKYERDFEREGDYYLPVTPKNPFAPYTVPAGTFHYIYEDTDNVLDGSRVKLSEEDGYYHVYEGDTDRGILFVKLTRNSPLVQGNTGPGVETAPDIGFMEPLINFKINGKDYTDFIRRYYKAWVDANDPTNGTCPMTEELKEFMQAYAVSQSFFNDGNGWAETVTNLNSSEENMWLFNSGFYY